MNSIKIIGLYCAKVQQTLMNAEAAASEFDENLKVFWINDCRKISQMGSIYTPTVLVNDKLKLAGRVPSVYELKKWIEEELEEELVA